MGMHFGILAARCPFSALAAQLAPLGIRPGAVRGPDDDLATDELTGGEHAGRSYIIDPLMELSAQGDGVVALSAQLQTLVVGCGAETVSGSFWAFVAERGQLLRSYWACTAELSAPYSEGELGAGLALDDLDGEGLMALLRQLGFDYDGFFENAPKRELLAPDSIAVPDGPVKARVRAHRARHLLPPGQRPLPQLVLRPVRDEGGAGHAGRAAATSPPVAATPSPAASNAPVEFAVAGEPRSLAALLLLVLVALPFAVAIFGQLLSELLGRHYGFPLGVTLAALGCGWLAWRQRAQPPGVLRLTPGRLYFSARAGGPLESWAANLRDFSLQQGYLIVRQKYGPRLVLHPRRFSVPLETVQRALVAWVARGAGSDAFAQASAAEELRLQRRQQRLRWYRTIAFGCAVATALVRMLLHHH